MDAFRHLLIETKKHSRNIPVGAVFHMNFGIKNIHHAWIIIHVFYPFHLYFQGFAPRNIAAKEKPFNFYNYLS